MSSDSFQELILSELREVKGEIREVRQTDIPEIKVKIASFQTNLDTVKKQQMWSTRVYTLIGGAIAVVITKMTGHS